MSNNLLQNTIENTQETIQNPIMSAYTVNTSAFQAVMEREFNAYLKNMSNLGLLTVSVKACKDAIATGVAVEVKAKKSTGRPKKAPARKVSDGDIIDDLVAKADAKPKKARKPKMTAEEKAAKKAAKEAEKEAKKAAKKLEAEKKKAEKAALKDKLKAEKLETKRLEKEQKALEKAKIKAEKLAAKEAEKEAKKAAKAELKAQKKAEKKAAKMKDDERKKQEALALMTAAIEDSTNDVPITNAQGEVIGSKVEGFNLPEEKPSADELVEEESISGLPEGYKVFTHNSRPDEKLVIDETTKNVFKVDTEGDLDHIGQLAEDGTLLECEDSSDEEEEDFPEM
jgi:flagellar biosynthesis GTPase FlhF